MLAHHLASSIELTHCIVNLSLPMIQESLVGPNTNNIAREQGKADVQLRADDERFPTYDVV